MTAAPAGAADDDGAPEVWLTQNYAQRLDYGLMVEIENEERFFTEGSETLGHYELTPQLVWRYSPRYDFGVGYMFEKDWMDGGMTEEGNSGLFFATIKVPLSDWLVTSRQRFEFGDREGETTGMFRQQTRVIWETERLPFHLKPFVSDEWFFDLIEGDMRENRFLGGLMYEINQAFSVEVFGMRLDRWDAMGNHTDAPVAGVGINATF